MPSRPKNDVIWTPKMFHFERFVSLKVELQVATISLKDICKIYRTTMKPSEYNIDKIAKTLNNLVR